MKKKCCEEVGKMKENSRVRIEIFERNGKASEKLWAENVMKPTKFVSTMEFCD